MACDPSNGAFTRLKLSKASSFAFVHRLPELNWRGAPACEIQFDRRISKVGAAAELVSFHRELMLYVKDVSSQVEERVVYLLVSQLALTIPFGEVVSKKLTSELSSFFSCA